MNERGNNGYFITFQVVYGPWDKHTYPGYLEYHYDCKNPYFVGMRKKSDGRGYESKSFDDLYDTIEYIIN